MKIQKLLKFLCTLLVLFAPLSYGFSAYSNKELDELEKEFKQSINASPLVIRTPLAKDYINDLATRLTLHANMDKPYFFIVNSPEINAFAGPGGYIGVNSQLILATETESELAAVMAHEMSHVRLHHLYRMIEHQKQMQIPELATLLAAAALSVVNPALGGSALMGALTGFQQNSINFVRSNEKEADNIGIHILSKANLDPHGMPNFFKKMKMNMRYYYTDHIPAILRTHPLDEDRIAEADNRIAQLKHLPIVASSNNYYLFKELIRHEVAHDPQKQLEYYKKQCLQFSPKFACNYGQALTYLELNRNQQALVLLNSFQSQAPFQHSPFIQLALAQANQNIGHATDANNIYEKFYQATPNDSAVVNQYSEFLDAENNPKEALKVLTKAHRKMKQDLGICKKLARVQAQLKMTAQAYFTEANCHLIQGEKKRALQQLNTGKSFAKPHSYIYERIVAKIDEVKEALDDH